MTKNKKKNGTVYTKSGRNRLNKEIKIIRTKIVCKIPFTTI